MATPRPEQPGSGVLDAIEGLAAELEQVQLRVSALERRMDAAEADPGPELVARRISAPEAPAGSRWERFEQRADRIVEQLTQLERSASEALAAPAGP